MDSCAVILVVVIIVIIVIIIIIWIMSSNQTCNNNKDKFQGVDGPTCGFCYMDSTKTVSGCWQNTGDSQTNNCSGKNSDGICASCTQPPRGCSWCGRRHRLCNLDGLISSGTWQGSTLACKAGTSITYYSGQDIPNNIFWCTNGPD